MKHQVLCAWRQLALPLLLLAIFFCVRSVKAQPELAEPLWDNPVKMALRDLQHRDPNIRLKATEQLEPLQDPAAMGALATAIRDSDVRVRCAAIRAYSEYREKAPIQPLLDALKSRHDQERAEALSGLRMRVNENDAAPEVVEQIFAMILDKSPSVRSTALNILSRVARVRVLPLLIQALRDDNPGVRAHAAFTLGCEARPGTDPEVVDALLEGLWDKEPGVRGSCIDALAAYRAEKALEPLMEIARNEADGYPLRERSLRALAVMKDPRAVRGILAAANDPSDAIRAEVMNSLRAFRQPEVSAVLLAGLEDKAEVVRLAAVQSLGYQGDPRALAVLSEILRDKDEQRSRSALDILIAVGTPDVYPAVVGVLTDTRPSMRDRAQRYLQEKRDAALIPLYLPLMKEDDPALRGTVAKLLIQFRDPRVAEALTAALEDPAPAVRKAVLQSLSQVPGAVDPRMTPALTKLLGDADAGIRRNAALVMYLQPDARAIPALITALEDEESDVRRYAADALLKIGEPALPELLKLAKSVSPRMRTGVVNALRKASDARARTVVDAALKDADGEVRAAAVTHVGMRRDPARAKTLLAMLTDPDPRVRQAAACALPYTGKMAVEALAKAARDPEFEVCEAAFEALGRVDHPLAFEALLPLANQADKRLRARALRAIGQRMSGQYDPRGIALFQQALQGDDVGLIQQTFSYWSYLGRPGAELIKAALADPRPEVRKLALEVCTHSRDAVLVLPLTALLQDKDALVREKAIQTLGILWDARAVPALIAVMRNDANEYVRWGAAQALGALKDPRAVEPLLAAAANGRVHLGYVAAALGKIGDPRASDALVGMLGDKDSFVRSRALNALVEIRDPRAGEAALKGLWDENSTVRAEAARAMAVLKMPEAVEPLITFLRAPSQETGAAVTALGAIGDPRAMNPLLDLLAITQDPQTRRNIINALHKFTDPRIPDVLIEIVSNPREGYLARDHAAYVLGEMKVANAIPALTVAVRDGEYNIGLNAARALANIGGPGVEALLPLLKDPDERLRYRVAAGIGDADGVGGAHVVDALIEALQAGNDSAAEALGKIGDARAVPALLAALNTGDFDVSRYPIIEALGKLKAVEAVPVLIDMLRDAAAAGYQNNLIAALGEIGNPRAEAAILPFINDEQRPTQVAAVRALGKLRSRAAVIPLVVLLHGEEDKTVRTAIAETLGRIGDRQAIPALITLLADENAEPRGKAALSLSVLTNEDFGEDAAKWRAWVMRQMPVQ